MTGEPSYRNSESYATSEYLFGHKGMFLWRGPFPSDDFFNGTDHALVTNRLRWLIKNSTVVEPNKPRKTASGL